MTTFPRSKVRLLAAGIDSWFCIAMALAQFEARRQVALAEANAIDTTGECDLLIADTDQHGAHCDAMSGRVITATAQVRQNFKGASRLIRKYFHAPH
jgi:hypothetical protein